MNNSSDQQMDDANVIHLWCGPRSLSTVTMYSFAQRSDTVVVDEPLYGNYLNLNPSVYRPYREELLASTEIDPDVVIKTAHCLQLKEQPLAADGQQHPPPNRKKIVFMKHLGMELANAASGGGCCTVLYADRYCSALYQQSRSRDSKTGRCSTAPATTTSS